MKVVRYVLFAVLCLLPLLAALKPLRADDASAPEARVLSEETQSVVTPEQAKEHMGKEVVVEGTVVSTGRSSKACFLNFAHDRTSFYVVIFDPALSTFGDEVESRFKGKKVRVKGTVSEHKGRPQIVVKLSTQINVVGE